MAAKQVCSLSPLHSSMFSVKSTLTEYIWSQFDSRVLCYC
uniref:Uncharacterized protein n=1 Tax=Anguilla anguilla TaxID=7936 RepID=A0A0E9WAN4_ANGAN